MASRPGVDGITRRRINALRGNSGDAIASTNSTDTRMGSTACTLENSAMTTFVSTPCVHCPTGPNAARAYVKQA